MDEDEYCPPMPADFWPEKVLVTASFLGFELAFCVSKDNSSQLSHPAMLALRMSLWNAAMWKNKDGSFNDPPSQEEILSQLLYWRARSAEK